MPAIVSMQLSEGFGNAEARRSQSPVIARNSLCSPCLCVSKGTCLGQTIAAQTCLDLNGLARYDWSQHGVGSVSWAQHGHHHPDP